jgi:7-cyano-7-deazaguanine synthase
MSRRKGVFFGVDKAGAVVSKELRDDPRSSAQDVVWLGGDSSKPKAIVVLSGGQDSTTCLAQAIHDGYEVHAITFNYGQRHAIEVQSAVDVAIDLGVASHEIIDLGGSILKSTSPLVSENPVGTYEKPEDVPGGVANTFVPARNLLFLTIAANRAAVIGAKVIYVGVCETDFSGYPDCRNVFVRAMEGAIGLGLDGAPLSYKIKTPLMYLTKAQSVLLAQKLLGDRFDEVMGHTSTCYSGVKGGCGKCAACLLRDRGFIEAGIEDPIWKYRQQPGETP